MAVTPRTIIRNPLLLLLFSVAAIFAASFFFTNCPVMTACKAKNNQPYESVQPIHQMNVAHNTAGYGWLGIEILTMTPQQAQLRNMQADRGVLVVSTQRHRPAVMSGIRANDVIVQYDGMAMRSACQLKNAVGKTTPGTRVPVTVNRDGHQITFYPVVTDRDGALGCGATCR